MAVPRHFLSPLLSLSLLPPRRSSFVPQLAAVSMPLPFVLSTLLHLSMCNLGLSRPHRLLSTGTSLSVCLSFAVRLLRCLLSCASASRHLLLCSCLTCSSLIPPLSSCQLVVTSHHFTLPPPLNASSPHDWLCRHTNAPYSMTITMCHNAKHIDQYSRSRSTVDATGRHHWASIHHVSPRLRPWS